MRASIVTVMLLALTVGGAGWSAGGDRKAENKREVVKALVQAEHDFAKRRQELGLVGSAPLFGLAGEASALAVESAVRPTSEHAPVAVTTSALASAAETSVAPQH